MSSIEGCAHGLGKQAVVPSLDGHTVSAELVIGRETCGMGALGQLAVRRPLLERVESRALSSNVSLSFSCRRSRVPSAASVALEICAPSHPANIGAASVRSHSARALTCILNGERADEQESTSIPARLHRLNRLAAAFVSTPTSCYRAMHLLLALAVLLAWLRCSEDRGRARSQT